METQTRLIRHNKFILAENIIAIHSVSSDDILHAFLQYIYIYIYIDSVPVTLFNGILTFMFYSMTRPYF